jgi:hypothetical protein
MAEDAWATGSSSTSSSGGRADGHFSGQLSGTDGYAPVSLR